MAEENDDIARYQSNEMSDKERNAFEKKALNDSFLSDAVEGTEGIPPEEFAQDVEMLSRKIKGHRSLEWKMPLRIAAGILLVITVGYLAYRNTPPKADQLALKKPDSTALAKPDSAGNLLTLAEPGAAQEASSAAESPRPVAIAKPIEQAPIASSSPATGASALSQPQDLQATEAEIAVMTVPASADAEIKGAKESAKSKADDSADRMMTEETPQGVARAKRSSAEKRIITGRVTEAEDGIPLPGVLVTDKTTNTATLTNFEGAYSIQISSQNPVLQYSFNGLETLVVSPNDQSALDVKLKDDVTMRSEVVILHAETGVSKDLPLTLAAPVGGVAEYGRYLENNRLVPKAAQAAKVSGKVTIAFNVTPTGTLTEFATVKSLGYGCDEEVIRLIKNGPGWTPSTRNGIPLPTTVWLKLEFNSGK